MDKWVMGCISNFHSEHYLEIKEHRHLPYSDFKRVIIEQYRKPDLTHSKLQELLQTQQDVDESPEDFMERIGTLSEQAFRKLPDLEKQTLWVSAFCNGLRNRTIAGQIAVMAKDNTATAVRVASELTAYSGTFGEKIYRKKKNKDYKCLSTTEMNSEQNPNEYETQSDQDIF